MRRYARNFTDVALVFNVNPGDAFQLEELRMHLDAPGAADDLTVTVTSNAGAQYGCVLLTHAMAGVSDVHWMPVRPINFVAGDAITIAWANAGGVSIGTELVFSRIP